jgi:hypothetical protein
VETLVAFVFDAVIIKTLQKRSSKQDSKMQATKRVVEQLKQYSTADEMWDNVERIVREEGLVGQLDWRVSDDLCEELIVEALQRK